MDSTLQGVLDENITSKGRPLSSDWLVSFKDPRALWEEHWFALSLEIANAVIVYQLLKHAKRRGQEQYYLLLTALFTALSIEILPLIPRPGYQLWWYHPGFLNFLKQRVPSYVVTSFAIVHYVAHNLTRDSNLPTFTRSMITSVCASLIYFPCLWMAPRLLLSFVHFDDDVFKHQFLGVPYIQILITGLLFFHTSHVFIQNFEAIEPRDRNSYNFVWCSMVSGLVSAIYTIVEQYLLYLLVVLIFHLNTGLGIIAGLAVMLSLAKDELKTVKVKSYSTTGILHPLKRREWWGAVGIFLFLSTLPLWLNTADLKSSGTRLELGPCHVNHEVSNTSPLESERRRFVCPEDEKYLSFDFHCVERDVLHYGVRHNSKNYTICGKPLTNPKEIATQLAIYSLLCMFAFHLLMRLSFKVEYSEKIDKSSKAIQ